MSELGDEKENAPVEESAGAFDCLRAILPASPTASMHCPLHQIEAVLGFIWA